MNKLLKLKSQANIRNVLSFTLNKSVRFAANSTDSTTAQMPTKSEPDTNKSDVVFGTGSKYAELDSVKPVIKAKPIFKTKHSSNKEKVHMKKDFKSVQNETGKEDDVVFGTLSDELDTIAFKTSVSYSKPLAESKFLLKEMQSEEKIDALHEDEEEKKFDKVLNHIRLSNGNDRPNTENFYAHKMKQLAEQGKIKEVIDVFFNEMIERDRFKPTLWLYKTLMKILAQAGYTHMVFALFKRLTGSHDDDWQKPSNRKQLEAIVTILFQACANSSWPEYAVKKTDSIRFYLKNRNIIPNEKNYSAMISAYGKAGAIYEAFNVVDEMSLNGIKPNLSTFSNLLCACISQKDTGFKYALLVWQMCLKFKVKPDLTMYNLILRASNDCSLGLNSSKQLPHLSKASKRPRKPRDNINLFPVNSQERAEFRDVEYETLQSSSREQNDTLIFSNSNGEDMLAKSEMNDKIELTEKDVQIVNEQEMIGKSLQNQIKELEWWQDIKSNIDKAHLMKDLAKFKPELRQALLSKTYESFLTVSDMNLDQELFRNLSSEEDTPLGHFEMLGGLEDFFKAMNFHDVKPDFRTFNQIILCLNEDFESEEKLLAKMKEYNLVPDIDFINLLMKRRIKRKEHQNAEKAMEMVQTYQLAPNIITFGCLANKVTSTKLLVEFLKDLKDMNFKLNLRIVSTLFWNGMKHKNYNYLTHLFDYVLRNKVRVDQRLIARIQENLNSIKREIIQLEKLNQNTLSDEQKQSYNKLSKFYGEFKTYFEKWSQQVDIETELHPYAKFARPNDKLYESFIKRTQDLKKSKLST